MWSLLGKKTNRVLGLDISSTAVKVLELSQHGRHYKVESYAVTSLPPQSIIESDIKDISAVADAIQLAIARSGSKLKTAAAAVSSAAVITKLMQMDASLEEAAMADQIQLEASRYVPYPITEVALDFQVVGLTEKDPTKADVLVVAARSEQVESRAEAIHQAGMIPKVIDVESYAIERACRYLLANQLPSEGKNKTIAIVDIGSVFTTITILHDLKTVYSREEVFGGRQLTEAIQRRYGLTFEQAGQLKKQGNIADDYVPEVLEPFKESIIPLIRRSLQLFFSSSRFTEIDHILLAGGGAQIPGLAELIADKLATPCSIANPFADMAINARVNAASLAADSSSLLTCCGLALRSFPDDAY